MFIQLILTPPVMLIVFILTSPVNGISQLHGSHLERTMAAAPTTTASALRQDTKVTLRELPVLPVSSIVREVPFPAALFRLSVFTPNIALQSSVYNGGK